MTRHVVGGAIGQKHHTVKLAAVNLAVPVKEPVYANAVMVLVGLRSATRHRFAARRVNLVVRAQVKTIAVNAGLAMAAAGNDLHDIGSTRRYKGVVSTPNIKCNNNSYDTARFY